jgi:hypothetical protein
MNPPIIKRGIPIIAPIRVIVRSVPAPKMINPPISRFNLIKINKKYVVSA